MQTGLGALAARHHRAFNERDFDAWRQVFDEDVELVVDGMTFKGVEAAVAYGVASVTQFPGLHIDFERVVAESFDTVVTEIGMVDGDPARGDHRRQPTVCEVSRVRDGRIVSCRSYYMAEPGDGQQAVRVPARGEGVRMAEERAALHRVAALVAEGAPSSVLFGAVTEEVGRLFDADLAGMIRYLGDDTITAVATWAAEGEHPPVEGTWALEGDRLASAIATTRRPSREDDWAAVTGPIAAFVREQLGIRSSVGSPVVVQGRVWGALFVHSTTAEAMPPDSESRLVSFTELVATAVSNAHARADADRLTEEQAALRRVATLVARESSPEDIFAAVAEEVGQLLAIEDARVVRFERDGTATVVASWGRLATALPVGTRITLDGTSASALVFRTGHAARVDDLTDATGDFAASLRRLGVRSAVGAPIVVDGRLWGGLSTASLRPEPLAAGIEARMREFAELAATAISNSQARGEVRRLADEQAALRRVATLVAEERPPAAVFSKVAEELASLLNIERTVMVRYEADATATVAADWSATAMPGNPPGTRLPLEGESLTARVFRTGRPVRMDDYAPAVGPIAELAREQQTMGGVGCPITVNGRLWGSIIAVAHETAPLPPETESRMGEFTELVATAIGNAEARAEATRLTAEQAALRRIATLVAAGASASVVFDAAAAEAAELLRADQIALVRFEPGPELTVLAHRGRDAALAPAGTRLPLQGESVNARVHRTGRTARLDSFEHAEGSIMQHVPDMRTGIATPIVVDGRLWGTITGGWLGSEAAPQEAEQRLTEFAELLAVAIANADSREQLTASRARMVTAGDDARRRVVRDLHDGAQQRLVQTIVTLKLAARALDRGDANARELVAQALDQASRSNEGLRELAHGILPAVLTLGGLRAAVGSLVTRLDLQVVVDLPPDRFPAGIEASAYFVIAEALTNVLKHSRAEQATVRACAEDGMLRVEISDDGVGGADAAGNGLLGIADRVSALGGQLRVESPSGAGTVVTAVLPISD